MRTRFPKEPSPGWVVAYRNGYRDGLRGNDPDYGAITAVEYQEAYDQGYCDAVVDSSYGESSRGRDDPRGSNGS